MLDEKKQKIIKLGFIVDGIAVFERDSAETWSAAMFVQRYLKKAGDFPIKFCEISLLCATTEIANEFFVTLRQRDTPETGFEKFHLSWLTDMKTPLEESVLQDFTEKLSHVKDFKVSCMFKLPE